MVEKEIKLTRKYYSTSWVAGYFNRSTKTIRRWIREGLIEVHKDGTGPGTRIYIPRESIIKRENTLKSEKR